MILHDLIMGNDIFVGDRKDGTSQKKIGLKCRNVQVDHNILMFSECARYASEVKVLQARIPVGLTAEAEELKGQEDHPLRSPASRNESE